MQGKRTGIAWSGWAAAVGLLAAPAVAQTASALLREGDLLGPAGHSVSAVTNTAVNHVGGYALSVNTSDGAITLSHIWGNASGGPGAIIRTEGTFGSLVQTSFESFYGISDAGNVAYSALGSGGPVGDFDSVWLDDTPVAVEGNPHPTLAGQFWRFGSRPGVTSNGTPYFVGGITDTQGGDTQKRGLFFGPTGSTVLLLGGDAVPGLPFPLTNANTISFDYRFSSLATNYMGEVQMEGPSSTEDNAMVRNGSGMMVAGSLVREGSTLPAAAGGLPGENWDNFDFVSITETGHYLLTGDSDADSSQDEFVMIDDQIILREGGMLLGGAVLNGAIEGGYMNEQGDWAVIWDADIGLDNLEALIVNTELLLTEGDQVDWDGNGLLDDSATLTNFTGVSALTVGDRGVNGQFDVYFTADVEIQGRAELEGFFCMTVPEPASVLLLGLVLLPTLRRRP